MADQVDYTPNNALGHFSLSQTGVLVFYSGGKSSGETLTWFDRGGKSLGTVGPSGHMYQPAISPDGATVAVDRQDPQTGGYNIWLHDLVHATDSRFTFDPRIDWYPTWSPDGSRILFSSNRSGHWGQYTKPASGTGKEELLFELPGVTWGSSWSRDGRFVIFHVNGAKTGIDLWAVPNPLGDVGARKPYAFLQTESAEKWGSLSPEGKYVAYTSDENRTQQVYVQTFPGKEGKFQISTNGGDRPVWSRDGKELFYIAADQKMMALDVKMGAKFEHGIPKPLFETRTVPTARFDISPDGKRFLLIPTVANPTNTSLTVVLNWLAGVKK